ncbi:MAG TPA: hypothetical protein PKA20_22890 [Burkholderiaceae bacterium]|nr:hypothetical protein [Burkholderiaceae bacterium]
MGGSGWPLLLAAAGCLLLYLSAPQQRWLAARLPALAGRIVGALLLAVALGLLLVVVQPLVAVFVWVTWAMLLWIVFPFAGVLIRRERRH